MAVKISVIVPTYNRQRQVCRTLTSVLRAARGDFEILVIDDGSNDNTHVVIARAYNRPDVVCFRQENCGRSVARNVGSSLASGDYLVFLDSDDEALPGWLDKLARATDGGQADLVCCGALWCDEHGNPLRTTLPQALGPIYYNQTLLIRAGTFAIRRDHFQRLGGYRPGLEMCEHTELAFRIARAAAEECWTIHCVPEPLVRIYTCGRTMQQNWDAIPETVEQLLQLHEAAFRRDPQKLAQYYNIAGVNAARRGDLAQARGYFRSAIRTRPLNPRSYIRWLAARVSFVASRVWGKAV